MGYYEIKFRYVIRQGDALVSKYFENSWLRFLDDSQNITESYFDKTR